MNCPKCGFENPNDAKYCGKCANIFGFSSQTNEIKEEPKIETMPEYQEQVKQHQPKSLKTIIFIIIGILVVSGLVYGGWYGYNNFIANTPENVLKKSFLVMSKIRAMSFEINLEAEGNIDEGINELSKDYVGELDLQKVSLYLSGGFDLLEENDLKLKIDLNATSNDKDSIGLAAIYSNNSIYFSIKELPSFLSDFVDITSFINKWVKHDFGPENKIVADNFDEEKLNKNLEIIKELLEEEENVFLTVQENYGLEDLEGIKAYHYSIKYNKNNLISFLNNFKDRLDDQKQKESIEKYITNTEKDEKLEDANYHIWIDKKGYYLRKFGVSLDDENRNGEFTILLDNFNKPLIITEPENTMGAEEFMNEIFGGGLNMFGGLSNESIDPNSGESVFDEEDYKESLKLEEEIVNEDSDSDGLTDFDETFVWGTDRENPDTDGDGYLDGEEVKNGYHPLIPGSARL